MPGLQEPGTSPDFVDLALRNKARGDFLFSAFRLEVVLRSVLQCPGFTIGKPKSRRRMTCSRSCNKLLGESRLEHRVYGSRVCTCVWGLVRPPQWSLSFPSLFRFGFSPFRSPCPQASLEPSLEPRGVWRRGGGGVVSRWKLLSNRQCM